jgi:hypothetical protein
MPVVGYFYDGMPDPNLEAAFRKGLGEQALAKVAMWRSNTASRAMIATGVRNWRPIWSAAGWRSSPRRAAARKHP